MTLRDKARAAAESYMGCICDRAYTDRGRSAPDCPRCNYAEDIADAMVKIAREHAANEVNSERAACAEAVDPKHWSFKTCNAYTCLMAAQGAIKRRSEIAAAERDA